MLLAASVFISANAQATEPLLVVATGGRIGVFKYGSSDPAATAFWHRTPHQLGGPVAEMQIGFMNWFLNYSVEYDNENDVTIEHAWLERALDGQVVPITFDGSRELIMPAASTEPFWPADPIDSSVWTGGVPQKDEIFWLHIKGSMPSGGKVCQGNPTGYSGSRFIVYNPANGPGTIDFSGTVPSISGQSARTRGLPVVFLGRYTDPGHLAVIGIGDSILDGSGDASSSYSSVSGFGYFNRAAVDSEGKNTIATFNLTRHGAAAGTWNTAVRQRPFLQYANVVVEEYGTNDLGSTGGGSVSTIQSRLENIWTLCRNAGVQHILRAQLLPRAESTDSWATKENQTPNNGWGDGGKRDELNAFFDASVTNGKIDMVVQMLDAVSDPTDSHVWLTNGSAKFLNTDSTHLNSNGNATIAPILRTALLSLTVDAPEPTYGGWAESIDWGAADSSPAADPNSDGVINAMAYALDISPLNPPQTGDLPYAVFDEDTSSGLWLKFIFRESSTAQDLVYSCLSSTELSSGWVNLIADGINVIEETLDTDPDGDGSAVLKQIKINLVSFGDTRRFVKLDISL
ncbi:hypothetical protein GCM10007047_23410 [Cerasicoccus arenae]|uniref:Uncharacterized protein n=2 Tax=Cerasicoccus arenae TaxID=424488 RepID=A0A8J3DD85_9BACT|nr:hypothetical protein GCM10007047_23410 [Cerasicoccus arenae]